MTGSDLFYLVQVFCITKIITPSDLTRKTDNFGHDLSDRSDNNQIHVILYLLWILHLKARCPKSNPAPFHSSGVYILVYHVKAHMRGFSNILLFCLQRVFHSMLYVSLPDMNPVLLNLMETTKIRNAFNHKHTPESNIFCACNQNSVI